MALSAFSQSSRISVSGRVLEDTQDPAIQATVQLLALPDSSHASGIATSNMGFFTLPKVKSGKYVLKISYIGFKTLFKPLQLTEKTPNVQLGVLTLQSDAVMLSEAVIVAQAPQVQVVEDTIQFNSAAYRTPQGAMLEELVKKLPGAEVDDDGNVTINGKEIKKIMVNGKEFFGGDVKTALENLPAEMIDKLKTYDKQSDLARITGIDDGEEETVLDLTVKKSMNIGIFGNLDLAAGTENRYAGRGMVNVMNSDKRSQVSLLGNTNNVNNRGFSGGGRPRGGGSGLTTRREAGVSFAKESDKLDMDGSARYNYRDNDASNTGYSENFLIDRPSTFSNSNSKSRSKNHNFYANMRLEWKPDTLTNIIFRPNVSWGDSESNSSSQSGTFNQDPLNFVDNPNDYLGLYALTDNDPLRNIRVNTSNSNNTSEGNSFSANATLQLNRRLNNKGRNLTLRGHFSYNESDNKQYNVSDTWYFQENSRTNDTIRRYNVTPGNNYNYNLQLTYSEPIAQGAFLQFSYRFRYSFNENDRNTYDLYDAYRTLYPTATTTWEMGDPLPDGYHDFRDKNQSKYAKYETYEHEGMLGFRFIREKFRLNAGLNFRPKNTELTYRKGDTDTIATRSVFNFSPRVDMRIRFSDVTQLRLNYNGYSSDPSMENLLPITDDSNPLNIRVGNPDLKPSFNHNVWMNFNTYNAERQRSIYSFASFGLTQNSISNVGTYNEATGGWTNQPENINGNWNARGGFGYTTALPNKKFTVGTHSNVGYSNNVGYERVGMQNMKQTTTNLNLHERLEAAFRNDWFELGVNGRITYNMEKSKLNSQNDQNPYNFSYGVNTQIMTPWNMTFTTNINNLSRRGYTDKNMNRDELIWNAQLSQTLFDGDATLTFEMYDILRNQSNISRSLTSGGRSVREYNSINSYCMLHFVYRINFFGGKEMHEKMNNR